MCASCMPRAAVPIVESFAASHRREVTRYRCPMRRGEGALRTRRNKTPRGRAKHRRALRRREAEKPRGAESGFTQCGRTRHCRAGGLSVLYTRERSSPSRRTRHRSASAPKRRATARDVLASLHNPHSLDTPLPLRVIGEEPPPRILAGMHLADCFRTADVSTPLHASSARAVTDPLWCVVCPIFKAEAMVSYPVLKLAHPLGVHHAHARARAGPLAAPPRARRANEARRPPPQRLRAFLLRPWPPGAALGGSR